MSVGVPPPSRTLFSSVGCSTSLPSPPCIGPAPLSRSFPALPCSVVSFDVEEATSLPAPRSSETASSVSVVIWKRSSPSPLPVSASLSIVPAIVTRSFPAPGASASVPMAPGSSGPGPDDPQRVVPGAARERQRGRAHAGDVDLERLAGERQRGCQGEVEARHARGVSEAPGRQRGRAFPARTRRSRRCGGCRGRASIRRPRPRARRRRARRACRARRPPPARPPRRRARRARPRARQRAARLMSTRPASSCPAAGSGRRGSAWRRACAS